MDQKRLNLGYAIAGGLFVATAAIHAFVGGPEVNAPVQGSGLDPLVRAVSAVVWHALTALFVVFGVALLWTARRPSAALVWVVLAVSLAFVGLFLGVGIAALGSVWPMPQWVLFGGIAGVLVWGVRGGEIRE